MKKTLSAIALFLVSVFIFAQHPRTTLVVNDSGGNQVIEFSWSGPITNLLKDKYAVMV